MIARTKTTTRQKTTVLRVRGVVRPLSRHKSERERRTAIASSDHGMSRICPTSCRCDEQIYRRLASIRKQCQKKRRILECGTPVSNVGRARMSQTKRNTTHCKPLDFTRGGSRFWTLIEQGHLGIGNSHESNLSP